MSAENEITVLRMELRMARERETRMEQRLAALERETSMNRVDRQAVGTRLSGEDDPAAINAKLRRLEEEVGSVGGGPDSSGGASGGGDPITGPTTWIDKSTIQKIETIKGALCGATIEATCNEDGTITVTLDFGSLCE